MNRRATLLALGGAIPMLMTARGVRAQTGSSATQQTLQYGTLAKETSQIAVSRSGTLVVQEFAKGEILEQTAIAKALTSLAKPPPAALTPEQTAVLMKVKDAPDAKFDAIYLHAQIQGHEALLKLQDSVIASGLPLTDDGLHIALIAKAFIQNHLYILRNIYNGSITEK